MNKIDRNGRVGIPQNLRKLYHLDDDFVELVDNGNGILIRQAVKLYDINEYQMNKLRELYIMLNKSGMLDEEFDNVLSSITKKSESVCGKCGSPLFLTDDNTLKCFKCE